MAAVLYRLGRFSYRSRRLVLLIWLGVLAVVAVGAATLSGPAATAFIVPGTESQEAFDLLDERFPGMSAKGAEARVVFAVPDGEQVTDPENAAAIEQVLASIAAGDEVAQVAGPLDTGLISPDGTIALAQVTYTVDATVLTEGSKQALRDALDLGRAAGLTVEAGGSGTEMIPSIGPEMLGLLVAVIVLVLTFGSLVAAGLPLVTGLTGVAVCLAVIAIIQGFVDIGVATPIMATMLGIAVGIDYSLFIVTRYRHELLVGRDGAEAAGRAIGTAGNTVVFAGATVVIALVGLSLVGIRMVTEMGLAAAFAVLVAILVALTLLPALLGFLGHRIFALRVPGLRIQDAEADDDDGPTLARRWVGLVTRRRVSTVVVATVAVGALAIPLTDLRLGFADEGTWAEDSTQRKAYDLVAEGFGPGFNAQLLVVADAVGATDPAGAIEEVAAAVAQTPGVQLAFPPQPDAAGTTAVIVVMPAEGPGSEATEQLVRDLRDDVAPVGAAAGADVAVTGATALIIDVDEVVADAVPPYLIIVVGLALLLLVLVFRSLLVPVIALLGFLLTIAATVGALVGVFRWGWLEGLGIEPPGSVLSMLPLLIVGISFGLAMDYQFFLVTRMREAWVHGTDARSAIQTGFVHSARVVAAAACIMVAIFAAFGIFNDAADIAQLAVALTVAIAVDAFVVRMTIVPAVLALAGERAWWLPRWLDRILPDVDVEGERLTRLLEPQEESEAAPVAR